MLAPRTFTIGITTKNRHAHLAETVAQLAKLAPDAAELLIVDDGSVPPVSRETWGVLPFPVRLLRHEVSRGCIAARNKIARKCRTAFILSCDDDSYPVSGVLAQAVDYLAAHPGLIALSFPYREGPARKAVNPSVQAEPYSVRQFIGCAHLMRVDYFLELGGYWEWLVQQNEERELCYRALLRGWGVAHFPGVAFYHDYTPTGRNWDRHEFYTMRNEMAVALRYAPWPVVLLKILRNLMLSTWWSIRGHRAGYLRGYFQGLLANAGGWPECGRLTLARYRMVSNLRWD